MAGEDVKELVEKPEAAPAVKSSYDDFVEGVATREIALAQGVKPETVARVFQGADRDGEPVVHIAGEGRVVSRIGDILERGGYRVQEWHIKRPDDVSKEVEKVSPELKRLVESAPRSVLPTLVEVLGRTGLLPGGSPALSEAAAAKELGEALEGFSSGKQTREESEGKEES